MPFSVLINRGPAKSTPVTSNMFASLTRSTGKGVGVTSNLFTLYLLQVKQVFKTVLTVRLPPRIQYLRLSNANSVWIPTCELRLCSSRMSLCTTGCSALGSTMGRQKFSSSSLFEILVSNLINPFSSINGHSELRRGSVTPVNTSLCTNNIVFPSALENSLAVKSEGGGKQP
uniref:Uncharacterized protein n=1 Tax=Cacopsylla melanoneura TaxID=428564 RepID=A0A8D8QLK2_9HEMI